MIVINCIATPRNISTALMYSFAQRPDTTVIDEPFYAHYLYKSGADHPGREDVLNSQPSEYAAVIKKLAEVQAEVLFIKNMAHHVRYIPLESILKWRQFLLIRDPRLLIASFARVIPEPTMQDIGLLDLLTQYRYLKAHGVDPAVVDAGEILKDPGKVLSSLCTALDVKYHGSMLSWPAGGRPEDGVWAKYWYKSVHQSTGFGLAKPTDNPLPEHCNPLLQQAMPIYETLYSLAIKA